MGYSEPINYQWRVSNFPDDLVRDPVAAIFNVASRLHHNHKTTLVLQLAQQLPPANIGIIVKDLVDHEKIVVDTDQESYLNNLSDDPLTFSLERLSMNLQEKCPRMYSIIRGLLFPRSDSKEILGFPSEEGNHFSTIYCDGVDVDERMLTEGVMERIEQKAAILLSITTGARNKFMTGFKKVVSLALYAVDVRGIAFKLLSRLNLTVDPSTVKRNIDKLAQKISSNLPVHRPYRFIVGADNINFYRSKAEKAINNQSAMMNLTLAAVFPILHDDATLPTTPQMPIANFRIDSLYPDNEMMDFFRCQFRFILADTVTKNFAPFHKFRSSLVRPTRSLPIVTGEIHPLPLIDADESTIPGMIKVLDQVLNDTEVGRHCKDEMFIFGDLLTVMRMGSAQNIRAMDTFADAADRFEMLEGIPSDFHFLMELAKLISKKLWGKWPGSLNDLNVLVKEKIPFEKNCAKDYNKLERFLQKVFVAFANAMVCTHLGINAVHQTPDTPLPATVQEFNDFIDRMTEKYFDASYVATTRNTDQFDDVFAYTTETIKLIGLFLGAKEAMREGRGEDMIKFWRIANIYFLGGGCSNYYKYTTRTLIRMKTTISKRGEYILLNNRGVNVSGTRRGYMANDERIENGVMQLKALLSSKSSTAEFSWMQKLSVAGSEMWDIRRTLINEVGGSGNSAYHQHVRTSEDVKLMCARILELKMLVKEEGRRVQGGKVELVWEKGKQNFKRYVPGIWRAMLPGSKVTPLPVEDCELEEEMEVAALHDDFICSTQ